MLPLFVAKQNYKTLKNFKKVLHSKGMCGRLRYHYRYGIFYGDVCYKIYG